MTLMLDVSYEEAGMETMLHVTVLLLFGNHGHHSISSTQTKQKSISFIA